MRKHLILLVAVALSVAADRRKEAADEAKKFIGTWTLVSAEFGGATMPAEETKMIRLVFSSGKRYTYKKGSTSHKGTFEPDPTVSPSALDIRANDTISKELKDKGKTYRCIYELEGDTLKIRLALPGEDRPREFASTPGNRQCLQVWKRVK